MPTRKVSTSKELVAALDNGVTEIAVTGTLSGMGNLRLPPGVGLAGGTLVFGARGLVLSADNSPEEIDIKCPAQEIAMGNEVTQADLAALTLRGVSTVGQVFLIADESMRSGAIVIDGLVFNEADLRGRAERPQGHGVDAPQGALTVWNRSPDPDVVSARRDQGGERRQRGNANPRKRGVRRWVERQGGSLDRRDRLSPSDQAVTVLLGPLAAPPRWW
jgi:hypothetical protein